MLYYESTCCVYTVCTSRSMYLCRSMHRARMQGRCQIGHRARLQLGTFSAVARQNRIGLSSISIAMRFSVASMHLHLPHHSAHTSITAAGSMRMISACYDVCMQHTAAHASACNVLQRTKRNVASQRGRRMVRLAAPVRPRNAMASLNSSSERTDFWKETGLATATAMGC